LTIAVVNIIAQLPVSNNIAQLPGLAPDVIQVDKINT